MLIPASALGGALVVVLADLVARTAIENQEMPLGVLTALVGGPFFFWLVRRTRDRGRGLGLMLDRLATRWRGLGSVELPAPPAPGDVALEAES